MRRERSGFPAESRILEIFEISGALPRRRYGQLEVPPTLRMNHILVTGGAGFIGSHLVERLLNDGKRVVVIDDLSTGRLENLAAMKSNPRLQIVKSKISECEELPKLAANAEFIFHLAATVGVELVVKSALHVLEASFHETQILLRAAAAKPHAAAADFDLGSLWQEREAGVQRGRRFAHRAARTSRAGATPARSSRTNFSRWPTRAKKTCRSSSRGCSTPSARARPGVTAWCCRASSRRRKRTSR